MYIYVYIYIYWYVYIYIHIYIYMYLRHRTCLFSFLSTLNMNHKLVYYSVSRYSRSASASRPVGLWTSDPWPLTLTLTFYRSFADGTGDAEDWAGGLWRFHSADGRKVGVTRPAAEPRSNPVGGRSLLCCGGRQRATCAAANVLWSRRVVGYE